MTVEREKLYINCPGCGKDFELDKETYTGFEGNVKCPNCQTLLYMRTGAGTGHLFECTKVEEQ